MALSSKQERFAELVAMGRSQQKAAAAVGIGARQARRWLHDNPEVQEHINVLSVETQGQAMQLLSHLMTSAAATYGEMMKPEHPDAIRLAAARGVVQDFVALRQYVNLVAELDELRAIVKELRGAGVGGNGNGRLVDAR